MIGRQVPASRNTLLWSLAADDRAAILASSERCDLERGAVLVRKGDPIETVWFPEDAVGSIIAETTDGHRVEAGLVGRDGFLPVQFALMDAPAAQTAVVQLPGQALSIDIARLRSIMGERPAVRVALLAYIHVLAIQTAQTALSNAAYRVEQRLARWLLMCHDRVDGNELPLIHEFVSIMLGVRRASVTTALHLLEEKRLISSERACILIRDREALEKLAGASYGEPETLYESVIACPQPAVSAPNERHDVSGPHPKK